MIGLVSSNKGPNFEVLWLNHVLEWIRIIKPQNLGSLLMKSRQSNFNLRSPSSYLACSYLIATVKAKLCWALSTNFWKQKVCWHHPAMFCPITSSKLSSNNLNFHRRWRWWDRIQAIFSNLFYFNRTGPPLLPQL